MTTDDQNPHSMQEVIRLLTANDMAAPDNIVACTSAEVEEIRDANGVDHLPSQYEDFLLTMGRRAGDLLRGTDFFYPSVVDLAEEMRELLAECNATHLTTPGSVLLGMHQGAELYWMNQGDPSGPVFLCVENREAPYRRWPSLLDFLKTQAEEEKSLKNKRNI